MNKTHHTILIILLALLILLPSLACNDCGMTCTVRCQHIKDDTAWDDCMLKCHGGQQ